MSGHEEYDSLPGIRWSLLRNMATSPLHYRHALENGRPDTSAMLLGRATHCAVLEPERFPIDFVVFDGARRGEPWQKFLDANPNRDILTRPEYDKCLAIKRSVLKHPEAKRLLRTGWKEHIYRWRDEPSGLMCKLRADLVKRQSVWDLKTTRSINEHDFQRTVATYLYHGQAAYYLAGTKRREFGFIAVESEEPHDVAVYELDAEALGVGEDIVHDLLGRVAACSKAKRWPGRFPAMTPLSLPGWAIPEYDDEEFIISGLKLRTA